MTSTLGSMTSAALQEKFSSVRRKLDQLGYRQPLAIDSLPLAERLLADLVWTTESLRKSKAAAGQRLEATTRVEEVAEPYRSDNAKLVKENNALHRELLELRAHADELQCETAAQLRKAQREAEDLRFFNGQCLARLRDLEEEGQRKSEKMLRLQERNAQAVVQTPGGRKKSVPFRRQRMELDSLVPGGTSDPARQQSDGKEDVESASRPLLQMVKMTEDPQVVDLMRVANKRIDDITAELKSAKEECEIQTRKSQNLHKQVKVMC